MTKPIVSEAMVEAGAREIGNHVGQHMVADMALDRADLRKLVRLADGYDINDLTQSDCRDAARGCLEAALAVRDQEQ